MLWPTHPRNTLIIETVGTPVHIEIAPLLLLLRLPVRQLRQLLLFRHPLNSITTMHRVRSLHRPHTHGSTTRMVFHVG